MADKSPAPPLRAIIANADQLDGEKVRLSCQIKQVCQRKGCFFIAADGAEWARVTFVDYSFFVPTDSAGKTVMVEGTFSRQTLNQAQADHYQADLGADDAIDSAPALEEYSIVATSVLLPRR